MDNADSHITDAVAAEYKNNDVRLVCTPANRTDLCAVTDDGLGRSVKWNMKQFREHFRENLPKWSSGKVTAADRRALAMEWFHTVVSEFRVSARDQIITAHQRCGSGLRVDGSENGKIKISGYEHKNDKLLLYV